MLLYDFSDRAEECIRMAERATSPHDRDFLIELACAWYGMHEEDHPARTSPHRMH
jgi:hypothetical protein